MRESNVTRTITTTKATVLCLDIESGEPCNRTFLFPRTYKKEKELLQKAQAALVDEPNLRAVHVVETEILEELYGMTESTFLAHATKLEKKNNKEAN